MGGFLQSDMEAFKAANARGSVPPLTHPHQPPCVGIGSLDKK